MTKAAFASFSAIRPQLHCTYMRFLASALFYLWLGNLAAASDPTVREMQRLLWALDYNVTHINGVRDDNSDRSARRFMTDRRKSTLASNGDILTELRSAYSAKRMSQVEYETPRILSRRALVDTLNDTKMVVSKGEDLVLVGSCKRINRYRLRSSAPLPEVVGNCRGGSFVYSRLHQVIVTPANWDNQVAGLYIADAVSGLKQDFIELPEGTLFSKIAIGPTGDIVYLMSPTAVWEITLDTRTVRKLARLQNIVAQGLVVSPDGTYLAMLWARPSTSYKPELRLRNLKTQNDVGEYQASGAVFSEDGRYVAMKFSGSVEVRELTDMHLVVKNDVDISEVGLSGADGSVQFDAMAEHLYFLNSSGTALFKWHLKTNTLKTIGGSLPKIDRAQIDTSSQVLHAFVGSTIIQLDISNGQSLLEAKPLLPFEAKGATMSATRNELILWSKSEIAVVRLEDGAVQKLALDRMLEFSAAVSLPSTGRVVVATSDGTVFDVDLATKKRGALELKVGTKVEALCASNDGRTVALATEQKILLIDVATGRIQELASISNLTRLTGLNLAFVDRGARMAFPDGNKFVVVDIASGHRIIERPLKSPFPGATVALMESAVTYITPSLSGSYYVGTTAIAGSDILYEYKDGVFSTRRGGIEGRRTYSFYAGGAPVAVVAADGLVSAVLTKFSNTPVQSSINEGKYLEYEKLRSNPIFIATLSHGRFLTADESGEVRIYGEGKRAPEIRVIMYEKDDWIAQVDSGYFSGTKEASQNLFIATTASHALPVDNYFDTLYRPDLVKEKLANDISGKVREAAKSLDLLKIIQSGPPPVVVIHKGQRVDDNLQLKANVANQGGGIGRVEWRINGITVGVDEPGDPEEKQKTLNRTVLLDDGENVVEVVAYNGVNLVASDAAKIRELVDAPAEHRPATLHALVIAVNEYLDSRLRLTYATQDAIAIGQALERSGGSLYERVNVVRVFDKDATAVGIATAVQDLGKVVRPRDTFVLFLAGHGKTVNGRFYFLPQDFLYSDNSSFEKHGIGQLKWQEWLTSVAAKRSMLVYDSCESGSLAGELAAIRGLERLSALERLTRAVGRTILSASSETEPALEGYKGHGVFTYALLNGFAYADRNKNGLIEVDELAAYLETEVPRISDEAFGIRQLPQMRVIGANFPIVQRLERSPHGP